MARGYEVVATYHPEHVPKPHAAVRFVPWTLTDGPGFEKVLRETKPVHVYHLASPAHVPTAGKDPVGTVEQVLNATIRLLDAVRTVGGVERLLYAASSEVYALPSDDRPLAEDSPTAPRNIYGICKQAASQWLLSQAPEMVTVVRPFNQIGPGQSPMFAVASFAGQLKRVQRGELEPVLRVGNIDVERDFCDVRDTALGHVLALEKGKPGSVYNVCSGVPTKLRSLVDAMIKETGKQVAIEIDPARVRKGDPPRIVGDATRLKSDTGWAPKSTALQAAIDAFRSA